MKEVNTKREHVLELERKIEYYEKHYAHVSGILNEICTHLLGPSWYSTANDSWTCQSDIRDEILAKYKKVKK